MNQKTETRDPQELRLHPLQKKYIAEPDKESAEWHSFVDAMSAAGADGIPEIFITADGQIMEGGRRWRAAKQLQWPEIQCRVRPDEDAGALIVESLLGQRNMQRGAKVFVAITMLEEFVKSAEQRRLLHLRKGVKTLEKSLNSHYSKPESQRALAEKFGVSQGTVQQAVEVQKLFADDVDFKAKWEPKLLSGEASLWNVRAAAGGAGADQSKRSEGVAASQLQFWDSPFDALKNAVPAWKKLLPGTRYRVIEDWRKTAKKLPADLIKGMRDVLDEIISK